MNVRRARIRPLPLAAVLLLGLLAALGTLDLRARRPAAPPRLLSASLERGALRAGAGRAGIDLPPDVVLGGYEAFGRRPEGGAADLSARALVLEAGGLRTALVLVELMTLPPSLVAAIRGRAAAAGIGCALVAATHTHAGPGGYDRALLPQLVLGAFDPAVEAAVLDAVSAAIAAAGADLGPARLAAGEIEARWLVSNRDHRGAPVDRRMTRVELARPDGGRIATVLRLAAHPTLLPRRQGPAGDWPGLLMDRLDREGGVSFVVQGAVGDARATRRASPGRRSERASTFAATVAEVAAGIELERAPGVVALGCAEAEVDLPPADLAGMMPPGLGTLVSNLADAFAPRTARVAALRLGDRAWVGTPGEPLAIDAPAIERPAAEAGVEARVVGIAQGYVSYLVGAREMEARTPSARNAWFGAALAPRLIAGAQVVARAVASAEGRAPPPGTGDDARREAALQ